MLQFFFFYVATAQVAGLQRVENRPICAFAAKSIPQSSPIPDSKARSGTNGCLLKMASVKTRTEMF
jgi:hypothetical protein